jgi:ketosteroid isomerase-like protein
MLHVSTGGEMAYATGSVVNEFRGFDGPVEYAGKYALIWKDVEGEWMIALYAISSNPAVGRSER